MNPFTQIFSRIAAAIDELSPDKLKANDNCCYSLGLPVEHV